MVEEVMWALLVQVLRTTLHNSVRTVFSFVYSIYIIFSFGILHTLQLSTV